MPKVQPPHFVTGRPAREGQQCPIVVDGIVCVSGQRIVQGVCLYHYQQRKQGRALTPHTPRRRQGASRLRDSLGRKECSRCLMWKPLAEFRPSRSAADGFQHWCQPCNGDYMREKRYGLTGADVARMVKEQGGCAICGAAGLEHLGFRNSWSVDHDHSCCPGDESCGKCIRAILCAACNKMIGLARDDPARLRAAAAYLER
jgi:hypothetical protein